MMDDDWSDDDYDDWRKRADDRRKAGWYKGEADDPLWAVRQWVMEHRWEGVICPACTQLAKVYRRPLDSGMANDVIRLFVLGGADDYVHTSHKVDQSRSLAKLAYWKLIQPHVEKRGWWRLTVEGVGFVLRTVRVPRYIYIYDSAFLGFEDVYDRVGIIESLATPFDYESLMRPVKKRGK